MVVQLYFKELLLQLIKPINQDKYCSNFEHFDIITSSETFNAATPSFSVFAMESFIENQSFAYLKTLASYQASSSSLDS